jgi:hypothetical protein
MNIARCLMTDAIEGSGISYWAEVNHVRRDSIGDVVSFRVRENEFERDGKQTKWTTVTEKKLRKAAVTLLTKNTGVSRDICAQFIGTEWDYDAHGVDCVVQMIALGEVKYG